MVEVVVIVVVAAVAVVVEVVAHDGGDGGPLDLRDSSTLVSVCTEGGGIARRGPDPDPHEIKYIIILWFRCMRIA